MSLGRLLTFVITITIGTQVLAVPRPPQISQYLPRMVLATVENSDSSPFIKVPTTGSPDLGFELYAQQVAAGTSGQRFRYFAKNGEEYEPLGEFPKLHFEKETGLWVSHEKAGTQMLRTVYKFQGKKITVQSEEIIDSP